MVTKKKVVKKVKTVNKKIKDAKKTEKENDYIIMMSGEIYEELERHTKKQIEEYAEYNSLDFEEMDAEIYKKVGEIIVPMTPVEVKWEDD